MRDMTHRVGLDSHIPAEAAAENKKEKRSYA